MNRVESYDLIHIGLLIRYLRVPTGEPKEAVSDAINALERVLTSLNFAVTLAGMKELLDFRAALEAAEGDGLPTGAPVRLRKIMEGVENVVFAEARTKHIFLTTERRYNTRFLLESTDRLFADAVFDAMPELCRRDFREASRAIAFGLATAAAFMVLRGTEGVLREFYRYHIRQKRMAKPMWAAIVTALRAKTRKRPSATLLDSLELIRKSYRNPTSHPEATYTVEETEDLLGLCIDVVNKMMIGMSKAA